MRKMIVSILSLMSGTAIFLVGHGLLGTLLSLRASVEEYSTTITGIIMAAYFAGYIVGTFKGPMMINRIGHIRVFAITASIASALVLFHGLVVSPWAWAATRFVYGGCVVVFYLVIESWLNDRASDSSRGQVFSAYTFVTLISLAAGQYLLVLGDVVALELFAIAAVLFSFSLVPIAWTRLPEPRRVKAPAIDIKKLIHTAPVGFAGCLASGLVGGAFWTISPLFALESGLSETQVAAYMSIPIIGGALFQLPAGLLSDRFDRRNTIAVLSIIAALFALSTIFISQIPFLLTLCAMFVFGGMYFSIYPISIAQCLDRADPEDFITMGSSLLLTFGVGAMVSPVVTGFLLENLGLNSMPAFNFVILLCLSLFCIQQVQRSERVIEDDRSEFTPVPRTTAVAMEVVSDQAAHTIEEAHK